MMTIATTVSAILPMMTSRPTRRPTAFASGLSAERLLKGMTPELTAAFERCAEDLE